MNISKNILEYYFSINKWYDESLNDSFENDFNNAILIKDISYKNIKLELKNSKKLNFIKYYFKKIDIKINENNLIFIPLYQYDNNFIGIGYLFTDKAIKNLNNCEIKTFCKFIITAKELNQFYLI